jgi:hypothetical protein
MSQSRERWTTHSPAGIRSADELCSQHRFAFLLVIPQYFVYVALAAWLIVFVGLLWNLGQSFKSARLKASSVAQ